MCTNNVKRVYWIAGYTLKVNHYDSLAHIEVFLIGCGSLSARCSELELFLLWSISQVIMQINKLQQVLRNFSLDLYYISMVSVLKFLALVASQNGLDKQCRPRSDCFLRSTPIRDFPVCYSDKHFGSSSPENQCFI